MSNLGNHALLRRIIRAVTRLVVPRYVPPRAAARKVAVVVPLSTRLELLPDEEISMRHLRHFLGDYDKYLVVPRGRAVHFDGFTTLYFDRKFFGSAAAHNQLISWWRFYRAFADYEFVLIYHLDSLVFSDRLLQWCDAGFDYVGAPWIPCPDTPWVREARVGNGGFTLMNVRAALQVLYNRHRDDPLTYWSDALVRNRDRVRPLRRVLAALWRRGVRASMVAWPLRQLEIGDDPAAHGRNNDYLWSYDAAKYLATYALAPVDVGLRFAFEAAPRYCFELNGLQLPFGCHAWAKFDRDFWLPHLLPSPLQDVS